MSWEKVLELTELDTPTVANGLELLGAFDPTIGYTGPDVGAPGFTIDRWLAG